MSATSEVRLNVAGTVPTTRAASRSCPCAGLCSCADVRIDGPFVSGEVIVVALAVGQVIDGLEGDSYWGYKTAALAVVFFIVALGHYYARRSGSLSIIHRDIGAINKEELQLKDTVVKTDALSGKLQTQQAEVSQTVAAAGQVTAKAAEFAATLPPQILALMQGDKQLTALESALVQEFNAQQKQIAQLQAVIKAFTARLSEANVSHAQLKEQVLKVGGKVSGLQQEEKSFDTTISAVQGEIGKDVAALRDQLTQYEKLLHELLNDLAAKVTLLQQTEQSLKQRGSQFAQVDKDLDVDTAHVADQVDRAGKLEKALGQTRAEYEKLQKKLAEQNESFAAERRALTEALEKAQTAGKDLSQAPQQIISATASLNPLLASVHETTKALQALSAGTQSHTDQLSHL